MRMALACIGVAFLAFAISRAYLPKEGRSTPIRSAPRYVPSFRDTLREQVVTRAEYDRIQSGMSYWQVQSVIGDLGTEISSGRIEGVPDVMDSIVTVAYSWTNDDGSNMIAMFQNDKLIQKAQFGLK